MHLINIIAINTLIIHSDKSWEIDVQQWNVLLDDETLTNHVHLNVNIHVNLCFCLLIFLNYMLFIYKNFFFNFFIKCMQSMTMTLSRRCVYAKLHVTWSKSLLYIFSLINHIDSLHIQALSLKFSQSYFRFRLSLRTLRVLLFRF